jgi:hypothetical protein
MNEDNKKETTSGEIVSKKSDKEIIEEQNNIVNIDKWIENREEFMSKVATAMKEGKDYHIIQNKKSLAKGGAEKIASIFRWDAEFQKDVDVIEAFKLDGLIAFICNLSNEGRTVGQGRGAATLQKNNGDPNKTIKMAQKSAYIDAVIRTSGLSDIFTQDLEDMKEFNQPRVTLNTPMQPNTPKAIPQATSPEMRMSVFVVFKNLITASKTKQDLQSLVPQIEKAKQAKQLSDSETSVLRGMFKGKEAIL